MMKQILYTLLFSVTLSISAQINLQDHKSDLQELIKDSFDDIFSKLDSQSIAHYYTKDFILLENGLVWNQDSIVNYQKKYLLKGNVPERINHFEFINIKVEGAKAWIAYRNYATFKKDGKELGNAEWLESANAIFTNNKWKLELLHSTYIDKKKE